MKQYEAEFLKSISDLPAPERAAAIAHRVYMLTASRTGWQVRTPEKWTQLDNKTREYNLEAIRTWRREPELLDLFLKAVRELPGNGPGMD